MTGYTVFHFLPPVKCDTGTLAGIYNYNYFGRQKNERTDLYSDKLPDIHPEFYLGTAHDCPSAWTRSSSHRKLEASATQKAVAGSQNAINELSV